MAVQKTDCYKVVNIGYLKSLIGSNIQNNNGEVVNVNTTQPDTYCPTYSELTGGTLIPNWSQGSTPRSDRDGITVNSTAVLGDTYKTNQLVDRKDLGVKYTRFNTLTIARTDSGNISECGGNATLSKTYNYTRYTTSMNDSCVTSTTSSVVDGACNELTYHTLTGSVTNCTNYSIGKNGSISSTTRTDKISATTTFRGATKASGVVNITQNGLSGEYSVYDGRTYTGLTVSPIGTKGTQSNPIGCEGGVFGVTAMAYYKDKYHWKDSCGTEYTSEIKEESGQETLANTATTKMVVGDASLVCEGNSQFTYSSITGRATDKFDAINCCSGGENKNKTLSVTYQGQTASQTFYQVCADCSSSEKCKQPEIIAVLTLNNGTTVNIEGSGELTSSMIESYKTTVTRAEIKNTCTSIGNAAFQDCTSLTSVTTPNSVTSIGNSAFASCSNLTSIILPNSVTSIGDSAFASCYSLTSVTIPNRVTSIGVTVFGGCRSLTSVTLPSSVTTIGNGAFQSCISLTSITIPNSVTSIGRGVFAGCTGLTSMTFPSSVTNIGNVVFTACTSLERIIVERIEPPTIENSAFEDPNNCPIYVPCESVNTYKTSWSQYASRITCNSSDCNDYDFNVEGDYFGPDETEGDIASTTSSMPQLTATVKSGFIANPITVRMDGDYYYYNATFSENTGNPFNRSAVIEFTDGQGCVFSEDVEQAGIGCESYYGFKRETSEVSSDDDRYLIATSNNLSRRQQPLTPTIAEGSGFLTEVEVSASGTKYEYYGYFNENTSTSGRTAVIDYEGEEGCVIRQTVKQKGKEAPQNSILLSKKILEEPFDTSCIMDIIENSQLTVSYSLEITQTGHPSYTKTGTYTYSNVTNSTITIPLDYDGANVESVYLRDLTFGGATTPYVGVSGCEGDESRELLIRNNKIIEHDIVYYGKYGRVCTNCEDLDTQYVNFRLRYENGMYIIYMDNSTSPNT